MKVRGVPTVGHDLLLDGHGSASCHHDVPFGRVDLAELEILAKEAGALAVRIASVDRCIVTRLAHRGAQVCARVLDPRRRTTVRSSGRAAALARTALCASCTLSAGSAGSG